MCLVQKQISTISENTDNKKGPVRVKFQWEMYGDTKAMK